MQWYKKRFVPCMWDEPIILGSLLFYFLWVLFSTMINSVSNGQAYKEYYRHQIEDFGFLNHLAAKQIMFS